MCCDPRHGAGNLTKIVGMNDTRPFHLPLACVLLLAASACGAGTPASNSDGAGPPTAAPPPTAPEHATACAAEPGAASSKPVQRSPGHYVSMNRFDTDKQVAEIRHPGVTGFQKRYQWRVLEPTRGQYDFVGIARDLALAEQHDLRYVVMLVDKTFNGDDPSPDYLRDAGLTLKNRNGGYILARWKPEYVERFNTLVSNIAARFDCHPNFEGIAIQESALSLNPATLLANGYTAGRYRDALISVLQHASEELSASNVFWYMNFLPQGQKQLSTIISATEAENVIVGGPDILPDNPSLQRHAYPLYRQFRDRVTLFNSMQYDSYAHERKSGGENGPYWSLHELFEFARDELGVSYVFWNRKTWRKPPDSFDWSDALPVIENTRLWNHQQMEASNGDAPE